MEDRGARIDIKRPPMVWCDLLRAWQHVAEVSDVEDVIYDFGSAGISESYGKPWKCVRLGF
ncbi:hypothetical protein GCM10007276_15930 [Agaricicola taiwanensis]|uniref:Uncharacterized protein n=1 Tax=Agaricicola taiwanensis TaxID=591372 RepID=A0A8J2VSS8_9RHOB|nr:hypothetical protein GCM10007276_15930 [Agaricicola taiwanensis]